MATMVLFPLLSLLVLVSSTASSDEIAYEMKGAASGLCIAVDGGSKELMAPLVMWSCEEEARSLWLGEDNNQLKNVNSGLCIAVQDGSTSNLARLVQYTCDAQPRSQWVTIGNGDWDTTPSQLQGV